MVESHGLNQTPQSSDEIDKKYDVWDRIFLDVFDLHEYFHRENRYGPVCFVLDVALLLDEKLPNIQITTNNPIYWKGKNNQTNYYSAIDEYIDIFDECKSKKTIQQKMVTILGNNYILPFNGYLRGILIDTIPNSEISQNAYEKLLSSLIELGYDPRLLHKRECKNCYCSENYLKYDKSIIQKLFM